MINLTQIELYILIAGWVFTAFLGLLCFAMIKFTPAKVFLKAWFGKGGVAQCITTSGMSEFKQITRIEKGFLEIKGLGNAFQTPNSHLLDAKAKVPMFTIFSNYGYSIDRDYNCIVQELREKGLQITTYDDYVKYLILAKDEELLDIGKQEGKLTQKEIKIIEHIREKGIELKSFKTYNLKDLYYMFPNNVNIDIVDAKVLEEVNRREKRNKEKMMNLIYVAMSVLIIVIAIIIFLKVYKTPEPIIQVVQAGIERIQENITM